MRGQSEPRYVLPPRANAVPVTPPMTKREGELIAEALHHIATAVESLAYAIATRRGQ